MRMIASGDRFDVEVIAEPFDMPGTAEQFAVRHVIGDEDRGEFVAAHVGTGFAIAFGESIDGAIQAGRAKWASKTPEERLAALERARSIRAERLKNNRDGMML